MRCLKKQLDNVEIHFLTKEKHEELVVANPYIDKIHLLQGNLSEVNQQLQKEKFDYIIDLHHNLRSQIVKRTLRVKTYSLHKLNVKKWLLVKFKINIMPNIHIVDRLMDTVAPLGVKNDLAGLDYFIPKDEKFDFSKLPESFQKGYVAVVLSGTYHTKRFPAEKHLELMDKADVPYILLGGKSESKLAKKIVKETKGQVVNLCSKLSINQSALIVKQAKLVVANDTGLMHIAAAFKKKILSIWGSTTPNLGMTPYLPDKASKQQRVEGLSCQPCSKIGRHQCPKKHFRCMLDQDTTEMASWVMQNY
ncbi:MAG TPA: glycosyltransferase family 9 protein [Sunxiuqinia sp.]|nr:glycosyltransferase family 9 protein [Sunxiuqinia sp.]